MLDWRAVKKRPLIRIVLLTLMAAVWSFVGSGGAFATASLLSAAHATAHAGSHKEGGHHGCCPDEAPEERPVLCAQACLAVLPSSGLAKAATAKAVHLRLPPTDILKGMRDAPPEPPPRVS